MKGETFPVREGKKRRRRKFAKGTDARKNPSGTPEKKKGAFEKGEG